MKNVLLLILLMTFNSVFAADSHHGADNTGNQQPIIQQPYRDIREAFQAVRSGGFFNLSPSNVAHLLNDLNFATDSENSILFLLVKYLEYCRLHGVVISPDELSSLLNSVIWADVKLNYLKNVSDHTSSAEDNTPLSELHIKITQELQRRGNNVQSNNNRIRTKINSYKISVQCVFRGVSEWGDGQKYYSSPVLINGYEIYYFLQRQPIDMERTRFGLAGFLRVNGLGSNLYNLPLKYSIKILHAPVDGGYDKREFSEMSITFTESEKAIGGKLTIGEETWEDVVKGRTPLTVEDKITVIISIDFSENGNFIEIKEDNRTTG